MRRIFTVGSAFGFGLALLGTFVGAAGASAQGDRRTHSCIDCGATGTTRYVRTIHPSLYVTRYRDRSVVDHLTRVRRIVDVTRIQPIIHVHDVTRVHHVTLVSVREAYAYPAQQWAPMPTPQPGFLQPGILQQGAGIAYGCSCGGDE